MAKRGVHINVYKSGPNTWRCDLKINASDTGGGLTARGVADTMKGYNIRHAVKGALTIAQQAIKNPAIAAVFPKYTAPALAALHAIQNAQKRGLLGKVQVQLRDPTLKKLARELNELEQGKRNAMSGGGVVLCEGSDRDEMGIAPLALWAAKKYGPGGAKAAIAALKKRKRAKAMQRLAAKAAARRDQDEGEDQEDDDDDPETAGYAEGEGADGEHLVEEPPFGLSMAPGKFGLPVGNPHPFAASIEQQIEDGAMMGACGDGGGDASMRRLAAMHQHQRDLARGGRR
jgi:hypothetical protein